MIQRDLDEDGEFLYLVGSHCTPDQGGDSPPLGGSLRPYL